jgi:hypothetical protein
MNQWLKLLQITTSIHLTNEQDVIIWQYKSAGRYLVQSLYAIINNGGVQACFYTYHVENSRDLYIAYFSTTFS